MKSLLLSVIATLFVCQQKETTKIAETQIKRLIPIIKTPMENRAIASFWLVSANGFLGRKNANVRPLVWTTQLMAPEAYTVHDAITGWIDDETPQQIRLRAANAYSKY